MHMNNVYTKHTTAISIRQLQFRPPPGATSLHAAAARGHDDVVAALLKADADI